MDFSVIFQLRTKKFWWMDVIFYFVISLLVAAMFCWVIFLTKNNFIRNDIKIEDASLQTVGTLSQKEHEKEVINYQGKISDFADLLKNHQFASNVFVFVQAQTMPNIWFKQFGLDQKNAAVQLSGEADNMDAFSRQVAAFEGNEYVKNIGTLNTSSGNSARTEFNIALALGQDIFNYIANVSPASQTSAPSAQPSPTTQTTPVGSQGASTVPATTPASGQQSLIPHNKSSEKLITSFHLLLNPEVIGVLDETNYTVTLNVPYGTDVKNLITSIITSPNATVLPASYASQDFTNPVAYTVTAEDGSTQKYMITVVVAAPPPIKKPNQSGLIGLIVIVIVIIIVTAAVVFFILRKNKNNSKTP